MTDVVRDTNPDLHVDLIGHDWHRMRMYLIERRAANEPNAGKDGDYAHYSEPHSMADCPFIEDERVAELESELRVERVRREKAETALREMLDFAARWDGYQLDDAARLNRIYELGMAVLAGEGDAE